MNLLRKTLPVALLACALMVVSIISAQENVVDEERAKLSAEYCKNSISEVQAVRLAYEINDFNISSGASECLEILSEENRTQEMIHIYEIMAELKGITLEALKTDLAKSSFLTNQSENDLINGQSWQEYIEKGWPGWENAGTYNYYTHSTLCDGDASDTDYIFLFAFGSNIDQPHKLRSWSQSGAWSYWNVFLMLQYYDYTLGGLNAWGDTGNGIASVCIGNTGYTMAGGSYAISAAMRLRK